MLQDEEQRGSESSGSGIPSSSCPGSAVPPAQSDRNSGPSSPNTSPEKPLDPCARPSILSRLGPMPALISQASIDQVGTLQLLGLNCYIVNFTDTCLPLPYEQSSGQC